MERDELFLSVHQPGVDGTNNESERSLRSAAGDRSAGRTSKTPSGARRRTVTSSIFESLTLHLTSLTLESVVAEAESWLSTGVGRFRQMVESLQLPRRNSACCPRCTRPAPAETFRHFSATAPPHPSRTAIRPPRAVPR
jgi:hypothetical protein